MLLLFETASGYGLFKVVEEEKLFKCEDVISEFSDTDKLSQLLCLKAFDPFKDSDDAIKATTSLLEGKLNKKLKKLISKELEEGEQLAVADTKLATIIKEKLEVSCVANSAIQQLMSCIRGQMETLIPDLNEIDNSAMQLALAHGFVKYFSFFICFKYF